MNQLHRIGGHHMSSNQPSPLQQRNQAGLFAVGSMKTSVLPLGCRTNIVSTSNCQPTGRSAKMNREPVTNTDLTANHQQINAFRTTDHLIAASSRSILNYSANSVTNRNQLNPSQTNHTSPTFLNPQLLKPNYDPANYHMRVPVNPENRLMLDSIIRQPTQHMTSPRPNYHHRNLPALPGLPVIGTCCPAVRMQMSTNRPVQLQNDDFPNAAQSRQATQQNGLQNNPANNLDNNHQRKLSPNFSDELPNSTLAATNSWSHGNRSEDGAELMNGISPSLNRYTVAINVDNIKQSVKSGDQSKDKFVDGQVKNDRLPANLAVQSGLPSLVECGCCLSGRMMLKINGLPNDLSANGLRWAEISMEEQEEERKLKKREKNRIGRSFDASLTKKLFTKKLLSLFAKAVAFIYLTELFLSTFSSC